MANRVLLNSNGLKVAFPGQNVLTAGNVDLLFTSDWPILGVTEEGTHTVNWNLSGNSGNYDQSVYFANAFSSVPATQMMLTISGGGRAVSSGGGIQISRDVRQVINDVSGSIAYYELRTVVYADRIRFIGEWTRNSGAYIIPNLTIAWKAFAYNY